MAGKPAAPLSFADSLRERRDLVARHPDRNPDLSWSGLKPRLSAVGVKRLVSIWEVEMAKIKLDKEEKEFLDSYERGEWKSVKNLEEEIEKHRGYARQTSIKDKRVNIRISSMVLDEL